MAWASANPRSTALQSGDLDERTAEDVGDAQAEARNSEATLLLLRVRDQAGLSGAPDALYGLHLAILSVELLSRPDETRWSTPTDLGGNPRQRFVTPRQFPTNGSSTLTVPAMSIDSLLQRSRDMYSMSRFFGPEDAFCNKRFKLADVELVE